MEEDKDKCDGTTNTLKVFIVTNSESKLSRFCNTKMIKHRQTFLQIKSVNAGYILGLTSFARRPYDGLVRTETCSLTHNKI